MGEFCQSYHNYKDDGTVEVHTIQNFEGSASQIWVPNSLPRESNVVMGGLNNYL